MNSVSVPAPVAVEQPAVMPVPSVSPAAVELPVPAPALAVTPPPLPTPPPTPVVSHATISTSLVQNDLDAKKLELIE